MKPKEYLYKHGHIKEIGRGRLSREHIAIIEDAVKGGEVIEGYSTSTVASGVTDDMSKPIKVEKTVLKSDPNVVYDVPNPSRDESRVEAYTFNNGESVSVGMRTVCNNCRCSLNYCPCPTPKVWIDHTTEGVVKFKERKNPSKTRCY